MQPPEPRLAQEPVPVMVDLADARSRRLRAERAELIGWLAGAVAHDVNNVLTAIGGYAELIEADLEPGDPRLDDTACIRDAVIRAGALVRQLLTVGRRQSLRLEVLDATSLVEGLLPLLASVSGERVRVVVQPCPAPAVIVADRSLLEQALLNLAVNARDAMPGGGLLTVGVSTTARDGGRDGSPAATGPIAADATADEVRITVEDTGVGIDPAVLPHIFEPFFSTKAGDHGSGIGLASVDEAARQCGGHVSVESRLGRGTTFTLGLPRTDARPAAGPAPRATERARGGGETILLVDADPEVRLVLARQLVGLGYTVVDAASPGHALALVEHALDRLDVVVTETALPDLSGPELATRIRAAHPSVPVVFLSRTVSGPGRGQSGVRAGDRVLAKPVTGERLGAAIRVTLDASAPREAQRVLNAAER